MVLFSHCLAFLLVLILVVIQAGAQVDDPVTQVFNGQEVEVWPRIVWNPKWGLTFSDVRKKVNSSCSVSQKSTLLLNGRDIFIEDLSLDGALIINAGEDAEVCCDKLNHASRRKFQMYKSCLEHILVLSSFFSFHARHTTITSIYLKLSMWRPAEQFFSLLR